MNQVRFVSALHHKLGLVRLVLVLALIYSAVSAFGFYELHASAHGYTSYTSSFSCGDLNTNHCYALEHWDTSDFGGTIYGAAMHEDVVSLNCNCSGFLGSETGFVNNEMWVGDPGNPGCPASDGGASGCWVEGGYSKSGGNGGTLHYFWADERPNGGYHGHDLNTVPSGDIGGELFVGIKKINSNTYNVNFMTNTLNFYVQSTSNSMAARSVDQGAELGGSGTATIPTNGFYYPAMYTSISNWNSTALIVGPYSRLDSPLHFSHPTTYEFYDWC